MQVVNIPDTSENTCNCESWIDHWERFSGLEASRCSVIDCDNNDLVGAHVSIIDNDDDDCYIIPLCNEHSQSSDLLEIYEDVKLISAKVGETCG